MAKKIIYPYNRHLKSYESLVTSYEQTRAGFVSLALARNEESTPYIDEAKALKLQASKISRPKDLLRKVELNKPLLTAAGLSDKALKHLTDEDKKDAILNLIEKFLEPAGKNFAEELVYRYLLTKGDALGGKMRNLGGYLAKVKLGRALISTLKIKNYSFACQETNTNTWIEKDKVDMNIIANIKGLYWKNSKERTLIFDSSLPLVNKNIDLILIDGDARQKKIKEVENKLFLGLGELKGGIDPAGADEYWKTANSALSRIRTGFSSLTLNPKTFFIAAAIEKNMAHEIYIQLESKILTNAANLTDDNQVYSICDWLLNL